MTSLKKKNTLILLIILLTTFFPSTTIFNFLKMVIASVLLIFNLNKSHLYIDKIFFLWAINIILATFVVGLFENTFAVNKLIHEFVRIIYYAVLVSLCCNIKFSLKDLYIGCTFIILVHFTIQLTQYLKLGIFDNFIETYYLAGNADNIHYVQSQSTAYAFRSGSIFINPNVYVCYPYLSTGVFLQYYKNHGSIFSLIMVIVSFFSVVLTGSRMGMVAMLCIIFIFLFFNKGLSDTKVQLLLIGILVVVLFNIKDVIKMMGDLRAFNLGEEAYSGSLSIKLGGLKGYLRNANPVYWLFGGFGSKYTNVAFDFEYAYIFAWFGVFGCYWYLILIKKIYNSRNKMYPIINNITVVSVLLTAMAATSILNMSVFPYIAVISFPELIDTNQVSR